MFFYSLIKCSNGPKEDQLFPLEFSKQTNSIIAMIILEDLFFCSWWYPHHAMFFLSISVSVVVIDLSRHFKDPCLTPSSLGSFVNQINHIYPTSKLVLHVCFWVYLSLIFAQLSNEKEIFAKNIESHRKFAFFYSRNVAFSFFSSFRFALLFVSAVTWRRLLKTKANIPVAKNSWKKNLQTKAKNTKKKEGKKELEDG